MKNLYYAFQKIYEAATAPLLCRSYDIPLRHWNVKKGDKVGVVGLGGLAIWVLIYNALGAHVVMITTSPEKRKRC
jgi:uncharacterized zinc-type alcohol dehydrogenase-like protein